VTPPAAPADRDDDARAGASAPGGRDASGEPGTPDTRRVDRVALGRWLALHAAFALACVVLVGVVGATLARDRQGIGDPTLREALAAAQPDVVLLGNSMLKDGVNATLLDELLAGAASPPPRTLKHALGGVYTAYWYLYLKNCALPAGPPELVVIPFRDPLLTFATFRIEGSYAETIARVSLPEEPEYAAVVARNTGGGGLGDRVLAWLRRVSPAYAARDRVRDALFDRAKGLPARLAGGALPPYASAVSSVLPVRAFAAAEQGGQAPGALDTGAAGAGTAADAGNPFGALDGTPASTVHDTLDYLHFDRVAEGSFLPAIVELCRAHGTRLALLRLRKGPSPDWSDGVPADLLAAYQRDIDAWLAAHGVLLLDTSGDEALGTDMYRGSDHLNEAGREHLTLKLGRWLARWWADPGAERAELERAFLDVLATDDAGALAEETLEWPVPTAAVEPVRRAMVKVALPEWIAADGDTEADPERSRWELLEDGRPLGPAHTLLPTIVIYGQGRYAHLGGELYFTASDDTSPRDNGRSYVLRKRRLTLQPGG
jgi:hypothetical protein